VAAGTSCGDGNLCNGDETCNGSGGCIAGTVPTVDDGNPCTSDSCDPVAGVTHAPVAAGTSCGDGNLCNGDETCDAAGACVEGIAVTCTAVDACHLAGTCDPSSGSCSAPLAPDGTECSDGNACTIGDSCQTGTCFPGASVPVDDNNPCTEDACDPSLGVSHTPVATGTSCADSNECNGTETCDASGTCTVGTPITCVALDLCHDPGICDPASGVCTNPRKPSCPEGLPPDPATVAPALDRTVANSVHKQTEFLYAGSIPIQTGVSAGTMDPKRACELHGEVHLDDGTPESGVTVTVVGHPEFGQTMTRIDGRFDLVVNGGGPITLDYSKQGYLAVQRTVTCPWEQYVTVPSVVIIPPDAQVTTISNNAASVQVARGSVVSDEDGARQPTVVFPAGTQALAVMPDGSTQSLSTLSIRITEYTVGPNGDKRMPADLPPTSAYTHAFEINADEALAAGATEITFNQPIVYYVDNFLDFPIGTGVPVGSYQRGCADGTCISGTCGTWVPANNGLVIKVVSVTNGSADLDTNGDNVVDSTTVLGAVGITPAELQTLAQLYEPGKSIWRALLPHFSVWDLNWGFGPPADAVYPGSCEVVVDVSADCSQEIAGAKLDTLSQTAREQQPIVGTPYKLIYQSDRVAGRSAAKTIHIPITGPSIPSSLKRIELEVTVAGRTTSETFAPAVNLSHEYTWDGLDWTGRAVQGAQPIAVRIGYVYDGTYQTVSRFGNNGSGPFLTGDRTRRETTLWCDATSRPPSFDLEPMGLGGWNVDVHHTYDPGGVLHLGTGERRDAKRVGDIITRFAGGGTTPAVSATNAMQASIGTAWALTVAPDGSVYVIDTRFAAIYRIFPSGAMMRVAGTGVAGWNGDEMPATEAQVNSYMGRIALARECDGGVYFADYYNNRVRYVDASGIVHTVAGNGIGNGARMVDGALGTQTPVDCPRAVAVAPDGTVYFSISGKIAKVTRDGIASYVAGHQAPFIGYDFRDGIPAAQASIISVMAIAVGSDGAVYFADDIRFGGVGARIRRIGTDGLISNIAGGGPLSTEAAEGLDANMAWLAEVRDLSIAADGTLYAVRPSATERNLVVAITPDRKLRIVAGAGSGSEGGPAKTMRMAWPYGVAPSPDGSVYIGDGTFIRRVSTPMSGVGQSGHAIGAKDGREVFVFDAEGRHQYTRDALTSAIRYSFGYDDRGRLSTITDAVGKVTRVEHDSAGSPTSIVAPHGQTTSLTTDPDGYLASITNPDGQTRGFSYVSGQPGLLASATDAEANMTQFGYDSLGRLTQVGNQSGTLVTLSSTKSAGALTVTQTTALGAVSSTVLQAPAPGAESRTITEPSGLITTRTLNGTIRTTLPNGTVSVLTPMGDPRFGLTSPYPAELNVTTPAGLSYTQRLTRAVSLSDPNDLLSLSSLTDTLITNTSNNTGFTSTYTASTRTRNMTSPAGRTYSMSIDALGRLASAKHGSLATESFSYDANGHLSSIQQGTRTRTFGYDALGMLSSVVDPLSQTTTYVRDAAGRVTQQILPDGQVIQLGYDGNGRLASFTPPGRAARLCVHTAAGRLAQYAEPPVDGSGTSTTQYAYDADSRLISALRADGSSMNLAYDVGSRIGSVTLPGGLLGYTYSPTSGRLAAASGPNAEQITYAADGPLGTNETWSGTVSGQVRWNYDSYFKLISESVNGANVISYAYDAEGVMTKAGLMTLVPDTAAGIITSTALRGVTDSSTYDTYGQRSTYTAKYQTTTILAHSYTRDALGRIISKSETAAGQTRQYVYGYDQRNRLTDVTRDGTAIAHYAYDSNDNRTAIVAAGSTTSATFDAQDRLLTQGNFAYTYGADGDLRTKTDTATGLVTRYTYDALGNLVRVELPDSRIIEYVVDAAGRRVAKKINGTVVQQWIYHNALKPAAEFDGGGNLVSRFVYADAAVGDDAADQIFIERMGMARSSRSSRTDRTRPSYMVRGGQVLRILTDHLGSPRLVVDADSGQVVQQVDYDEWGVVQDTTSVGVQPFGFAGGLYDPDTKLVRFGARDYDPEIGRWTSKEPMKTAGTPNLYEYAGSDPINNIDVDGLAKIDCSDTKEVECQDKTLLLDALCGPDAQGDVRCSARQVTQSAEQALSALGALNTADTDTTTSGVAASSNWQDVSTGIPNMSIGGDYTTSTGDGVGLGSGSYVANQPPAVSVGSSTAITLTMPTNSIAVNGTATDDGLPIGYGLSVLWYTSSGPANAVFTNPNTAATTATFPVPGTYRLTLAATDGEYMASALLTVTVLPQNFAPVVAANGPVEADLAGSAHLVGTVTDDGLPAGSSVTVAWSKISGPGTVTFSAPTSPVTDATFGAAGPYVLQLSATDGQLTATAQLSLNVVRVNHAPVVNAGIDQSLTAPNRTTTLTGAVTDDALPEGAALAYSWTQVSGPALATFGSPNAVQTAVTFPYPGQYLLRLSASDTALAASDDVAVTVGAPSSSSIPVVELLTPIDDSQATKPTPVTGNVSDGAWALTYRLGGRDDVETPWRTLATGTGAASGPLGTFDPTQLLNGVYTIRLASVTSQGEAETSIAVFVNGRMKVGNFTLAFRDLEVPVGGMPFQLTRTYDSRDTRIGDFGAGWTLAIRNVRVEKSGKTGAHWFQMYYDDPLFPQYCLEPSRSATVSVTMPSGRVYRFRPISYPQCQTLYPLTAADVTWQNISDPGSPTITLAAVNQTSVFVQGPAVGPVQFINSDFSVWDPRQFTLTTEDGTVYDIDQDRGLTRVEDRTGNSIQITDQGILHSSGKSIAFQRDTKNRITHITDPAGSPMLYDYDVNGDLVAHTDRESNKTQFTYEPGHYLASIKDPLNRTPIRNEYDSSGRLVKNIDALGNEVVYTHILADNEEQIQDRLGHITLYEYNDMGDILRKTDATGAVWQYTYDDNGNALTSTDPLGNVTTKTYDWHNNLLTERNQLNETTSYTYNNFSQVLTTTDPLGNITTNEYDASGNLTRTVDARGNPTVYTYDAKGNRLTETDALSHLTQYEYDASGNPTKKTDALGRITQTTYDTNNQKLTETATRVVNGTTETLTTAYEYDRNGKLKKTTFPDGSTTQQEWNAAGKRTASVDPLGQRTTYAYDDLDRLTTTTYPDTTTETVGYDAENRRTSRTDQLGRVTGYAYDAVGRVTTTTNPDTTTTVNAYDLAGNLTSSTNEAGKVTSYDYDLANRRISSIDPLGNPTDSVLDAAGRQIELILADGTSTDFVYDEVGNLTETHYADNSATLAEFDDLGRQVSKTDELGHVTRYGYDELGRLTSVTDALNHITAYGYDEQGNQITQTDANGHITHFAYDNRGRMTERQLPDGTSEHRVYDAAGRLVTRTDFAGRATTYGYDQQGRVLTRTYPDTTVVTFTYDAAGQRRTAVDARGTTQYNYDNRGRVTSLVYPDTTELDYTYDARGMRSSVTAKLGTTTYTTNTGFDDNGRIATVTDPLTRAYGIQHNSIGNRTSLSYPNTLGTTYGYDTRGRLTTLLTKEPGTSGNIVQSYAYTLDAAGKRTRIEENDGTIRQFGYDSIDRLVSETVTGSLSYSNSFGYDSVGNRLTQVSTGNHPGTVDYTYDNRDRLTLEGTTAHTYDANGNLTAKTGEATYTWNFENRLTRVALQDGTLVDHVYDVDGNRVQTTVTPAGGGTPTVTKYLVDTTGSLSQVIAELDGTGALTSLYVRAGNELLSVLRPTGQSSWATRYVHVDGLGSIRVLTDEAGLVTDTRDYEAFGVRNESAGSDSLAFGFAGEPFESLSQLAYHRARWMDPSGGRFLSSDPFMGRVGSPLSLHRYLYAGDDAVNNADPSGEDFSLAGISASISMNAVLSTLATVGRVAMAAAITCEARLMTSFFEPASPFRTQGLCKTRWFNHYTYSKFVSSIKDDQELNTRSGWVFLTTDTYLSGKEAKAKLALPNPEPPDGYFRIPESALDSEPLGPTVVAPMMDYAGVIQPGGGTQYWATAPVSTRAAFWIPVLFP